MLTKLSQVFNRKRSTDSPKQMVASQWQLMWWKFRKHRLALISLFIITMLYIVAIFAGFFAPKAKDTYYRNYTSAPPQKIHWFDEGRFAPFVYAYDQETDPETYRRTYTVNLEEKVQLGFFVRGDSYQIGLQNIPIDVINQIGISSSLHFFSTVNPEDPFYPCGADDVGRDMLSRLIYGSRISLSIGLVSVFLSLVLGILLGGISALVGGWVDQFIQRLIEVIKSVPDIPLWMALSTAVPPRWDPVYVYFGITIVLSLIGWTTMAREVRGKFLSLREEEFIISAQLDGVSGIRLIFRHLIPSFTSHIIAAATLAIPGMILGESALSFIGIGLRDPVVSWGVMLNDALNIAAIAKYPWLMLPGLALVITVLAFNYLGDG
jgi:peptide/nickel transport system permease protein